jgi:hypothetical protein
MNTQDAKPLQQLCKCSCGGTGFTKELRCQAMINQNYRQPWQCNTPAKPSSKYCGNHKNKEEQK